MQTSKVAAIGYNQPTTSVSKPCIYVHISHTTYMCNSLTFKAKPPIYTTDVNGTCCTKDRLRDFPLSCVVIVLVCLVSTVLCLDCRLSWVCWLYIVAVCLYFVLLCLHCRVSWVRIPPRETLFPKSFPGCSGVVCLCFALRRPRCCLPHYSQTETHWY